MFLVQPLKYKINEFRIFLFLFLQRAHFKGIFFGNVRSFFYRVRQWRGRVLLGMKEGVVNFFFVKFWIEYEQMKFVSKKCTLHNWFLYVAIWIQYIFDANENNVHRTTCYISNESN